MAITYYIDSLAVRPREESEKIPGGARGLVPHDDIAAIINTHRHPKGHIVIEIRPGTYTAEEMAAMTDDAERTTLPLSDYKVTWRAWYGDPLPEQMAGEPWETIPGGES